MSLRSTWILFVSLTLCAITTVRACHPKIKGMEKFELEYPCRSFPCPFNGNPGVCDFSAALRPNRLLNVKKDQTIYIPCHQFTSDLKSALEKYLKTNPTSFYYENQEFQKFFSNVIVSDNYQLIGFAEECKYRY